MYKKFRGLQLTLIILFIVIFVHSNVDVSGLIVDNPGGYRIIVILVNFPDVAGSKTSSALSAKWEAVADFYYSASYGKFSLYTYVVVGWLTLPNNMSYYGANDGQVDTNGLQLVYDSINTADPYVDFRQYERVVIIHAGSDEAFSHVSTDIWSMTWYSLGISTDDGAVVNYVSVVSEEDPLGIFVHETGHLIKTDKVGILPDLYDNTYSTEYVGLWSVMAEGAWAGSPPGSSPSGFTSPEKYWLGWITGNITVFNGGYASMVSIHRLEDAGGIQAVKIPISNNRYYMIEYRRKIGIDSSIPGEGVLITYTDETLASGHGIVKVIDSKPSTSSKDDAAFKTGMSWVKETVPVYVKVYSTNLTHATLYIQRGNTDIVVSSISVSQDSLGYYVFDIEIMNNGSVYIDTKLSISISIDDQVVSNIGLGPFPANSIKTVSIKRSLTKGVHSITVSLDTSNKIFETDEANNQFVYQFEIGSPDKIYVTERFPQSDTRVDVNSWTEIGYRLMFENGSLVPAGSLVRLVSGESSVVDGDGWVFFNVSSDMITMLKYNISEIIYGSADYVIVYDVEPVSIIWDKISVRLKLNDPDGRVDVGSTANISFEAYYMYDGEDATPYIDVVYNRIPYSEEVGTINITVSSLVDRKYGLTSFQSNYIVIIFDRVEIILTLEDPDGRVDVGTEAKINISISYESDGSSAAGYVDVVLNNTLYSGAVGSKWITVDYIKDNLYGLTVFKSNVVRVIYDAVVINITPQVLRVDVGTTPTLNYEAYYLFDGASATEFISFSLNSSLYSDTVDSKLVSISSISDSKFGLTKFYANTVKIIWDMIEIQFLDNYYTTYLGIVPDIEYKARYSYDGTPADVIIVYNASLQSLVSSPGTHIVSIDMVIDNKFGLTRYISSVEVIKIKVVYIDLSRYSTIIVWNPFKTNLSIDLSDIEELGNYSVLVDGRPAISNKKFLYLHSPSLPPYKTYDIRIIYRGLTVYSAEIGVFNAGLLIIMILAVIVVVISISYRVIRRRR